MLPPPLKTASLTLLGFTPVVVWECFSLWYYGFLFPNTAYAKLATGYTSLTLLQHGVGYFISSFQFDPVLAMVLLCGLTLPLLTRDRTSLVFALGAGLYLVYTLRIGGDFMAGRFLVLPYLLSVFIITRARVTTVHIYWPMFAATFICAFLTPHSPWVADYNYPTFSGPGGLVDARGVADERMAYVTGTGLFYFHPNAPGQRLPSGSSLGAQAKTCGQSVVIYESIGAFGYYAGPTVHVVDPLALGDPLLSRLPAAPGERIGHFVRAIPIGYIQTLQHGTNQIADPNIALYYSKLQVLISGNLFDPNRLKDIWLFNTGHYDYLIRGHTYQPDPNARPFNGC
jgi:arabinofuranosyltransferase